MDNRREELEAWWAFIARVMAFLTGLALIAVLVVRESTAIFAYTAALALMGPMVANTVAGAMAQLIRASRGGSEQPAPHEQAQGDK
jgi:glucose dehydrogenase